MKKILQDSRAIAAPPVRVDGKQSSETSLPSSRLLAETTGMGVRGSRRVFASDGRDASILASSESQGIHHSFPKDAPAPAPLQGHEEEASGISTLAGLIQVLARIDARVNAKEPARA